MKIKVGKVGIEQSLKEYYAERDRREAWLKEQEEKERVAFRGFCIIMFIMTFLAILYASFFGQ